MRSAHINRIIDHSGVDGPGNRTAIFFQGCNFNCLYCHNPETIGSCVHCGECIDRCPKNALTFVSSRVVWDESKCIDCGNCYKYCEYSATPRTTTMTVSQVIERIKNNIPFVRGITVSGGECSLHRDFVVDLFRATKVLGLSCMMDTNGSLPIASDLELMSVCDGVMLDIKCGDEIKHKELTGCTNSQVFKNLEELIVAKKLYEIRTVVLPEPFDNEKTILTVLEKLSPFLPHIDIRYKLIKFRPLGVRGEAASWSVPDNKVMEKLISLLRENGVRTVISV